MIKLFILSFLTSSIVYSSCNIRVFSHITKLNNTLDDSIVQASNCSKSVQNSFLSLLNNFDSKVKSKYLSAALKSETEEHVNIKPKTIFIQTLKQTIEKSLKDSSFIVTMPTTLSSVGSINTNSPIDTSIHCVNCDSVGVKNFKLVINNQSIWVNTKLSAKSFAYVSKSALSAGNLGLSQKQFDKKQIITSSSKQFFSDFNNIQYYKLMRPLRANQPLSLLDVTPKTIIKANKMVDVILKNKSIKLKMKAIARQSARLGDEIELYNPKTKKRISGKAVDYNKVMVRL